jgi:hypothetical protein
MGPFGSELRVDHFTGIGLFRRKVVEHNVRTFARVSDRRSPSHAGIARAIFLTLAIGRNVQIDYH